MENNVNNNLFVQKSLDLSPATNNTSAANTQVDEVRQYFAQSQKNSTENSELTESKIQQCSFIGNLINGIGNLLNGKSVSERECDVLVGFAQPFVSTIRCKKEVKIEDIMSGATTTQYYDENGTLQHETYIDKDKGIHTDSTFIRDGNVKISAKYENLKNDSGEEYYGVGLYVLESDFDSNGNSGTYFPISPAHYENLMNRDIFGKYPQFDVFAAGVLCQYSDEAWAEMEEFISENPNANLAQIEKFYMDKHHIHNSFYVDSLEKSDDSKLQNIKDIKGINPKPTLPEPVSYYLNDGVVNLKSEPDIQYYNDIIMPEQNDTEYK